MKQGHDGAGLWIDAAQVGALVRIAAMAGKGEVSDLIGNLMLPGNHVLDMKGHKGNRVLWQKAILTAVARAKHDLAARFYIHLSRRAGKELSVLLPGGFR